MDAVDRIIEQLEAEANLTFEELAQLPRWALVALAVRCARRAQPILRRDWPDPPIEFVRAIETALRLTEESARSAKPSNGLIEAGSEAGKAATTAANLTARFASFTVAFTAVNAAHVATAENHDNAVAFMQATLDACHKSATFAGARFQVFKTAGRRSIASEFSHAARYDFTHLLSATRLNDLDDKSSIDFAILGPLWPNGAPAGLES